MANAKPTREKAHSRPENPGSVTIKDIAAALGVSHSTVSRALNDHSHISREMKERVRAAALEHGYVVNAGARTLRRSSSRLIGLIVPNVLNELFAVMIKVLAARCDRAGYQLVLCVTDDDPAAELRHVEMLRQSRATGIVTVPTGAPLEETARLMSAIPVIQFSRRHPRIAAPGVSIDGTQGIATAVRHLASLGHARIAYIGLPDSLSTGAARARGFTEAMRRQDIDAGPDLLHQGLGTVEFGRATTAAMVRASAPPTAVVYGTADHMLGGLEAIRREGVAIPDDLSVIGFGDPHWLRVFDPGISTIGLALSESAEAAISMLLREIEAHENGTSTGEEPLIELEPFLVLRESTAPPRRRA